MADIVAAYDQYFREGAQSLDNLSTSNFDLNGTIMSSVDQCGLKEENFMELRDLREHSRVAGAVKQMVDRILRLLTPDHMRKSWEALCGVVILEEVVFFFFVGFVLPWAVKRYQRRKQKAITTVDDYDDDNDHVEHIAKISSSLSASPAIARQNKQEEDGTISLTELAFFNICRMAQLAMAVYMVDILKVILQSFGFEFIQGELPHAIANIMYVAWALNRISALKRFLLARYTKSNPNNLRGQVQLVDRMLDACLYCIGLYVTIDSVQEDLGAAAKGFVAFGSVGTLVVSLASQGLAAQLFNGLFLASSNRVAVGEFVTFGNGLSGTVIKLGWMETIVRGPNEIMITVPNKDLADQRVSNLSRGERCAVKQTLRFKYSDIDKLPAVLNSIKEEIRASCPTLIDDGSRPFRAALTAYNPDHIAAQVDCRFRLKPLGNAFVENRQNVLLAIARAIKQHGVEFAVIDTSAVHNLASALRLLTNETSDLNGKQTK